MKGDNWSTGVTERPDHPLVQFRGDVIEKRYWQISQVARECRCVPSKIRFLEGYFKIDGHRNKKGDRRYSFEEKAFMCRLVMLTDRCKLEFVKEILSAGMVDAGVGFVNQVAERNLLSGVGMRKTARQLEKKLAAKVAKNDPLTLEK